MDIIVHLGAHRSATTTLQRYLARNAPALRGAGVESWTPPLTRDGRFAGLIQKPSKSTPLLDDLARRSVNRVRLELDRLERRATRQLIVSEENIIGAILSNLRAGRLYPDLTERLVRFVPAVGGRTTRLAIGLRSYDSYWASALAYAIGRGFPAPDADVLHQLATQPRSWRAIVAEIAELCPDTQIIVWPFEALAGEPSRQVELLTGGICLASGTAWQAGRHNVGPDAAALNTILEARGEGGPAYPPAEAGRHWMPFDPAQRARMRARYIEDLDWLASGAGRQIRFFGTEQDTADQRRVRHTRMLDRASEVSGFAASARAWTPLNGGQGIGNERRMV